MEIAIFKSDLWHNHVKKKNKVAKKKIPSQEKTIKWPGIRRKKKKKDIQPQSDKKKC